MKATACTWWDDVSAVTSSEGNKFSRQAVLDHVHNCKACSSMFSATTARHAQVAGPHSPIDTERLTGRERRWLGGRWTRVLLVVAAVVIIGEAVPDLIRGDRLSADAHAARYLASWQIGFGVGMLVAAWKTRMSHAILALAATFATLTITSTVIDLIGGHRQPWTEPVHLVELIAVFLLWRLTPTHLLPWARSHSVRLTDRAHSKTHLRLLQPDPSETDPLA